MPYQEFYKDYDYLNIDYHYYRLGGKTLNLFTDWYEYAAILLTFDEDNYQKAKKLTETYNEDSCLFSYGNYVFYDKFIPHYTRYTINENIQINWIVFTGYSDELNSIFFGGLHFLSEHNELLIIDDRSYLCTNVFKDFSFE